MHLEYIARWELRFFFATRKGELEYRKNPPLSLPSLVRVIQPSLQFHLFLLSSSSRLGPLTTLSTTRNLQPLQSHRRPSYSSYLTPANNYHTTATAITVNTHAELCSGMIALRTVPSSSLPALAGRTFKPPSTPPSRHPSTASPTRRNSGSMLQLSFLSRNTSGAASCLAHGTRLHGSVLCYELINNVRLDSETHLLTP